MLGDQNAVLISCHISAAGDLLHHVLHERWLVARRQVLLDRIRIGNRGTDYVQLILSLVDEFAIWIIAYEYLKVLRGFVRFFFLHERPAVVKINFVQPAVGGIFLNNLFQPILRTL